MSPRKTTKGRVVKKKIAKKKTSKKIGRRTKKKTTSKRSKKKVARKKIAKKKPSRNLPPKKISRRKTKDKILTLHMKKKKKRKKVKYSILPETNLPRVETVMDVLKELTKKKSITDWRLNLVVAKKANIYAGKNLSEENELFANIENLTVTVYRLNKDGTMGEAQITVLSNKKVEIRKELLKAVLVCDYAKKKSFHLPEPEEGIVFPESHDTEMYENFQSGNGVSVPKVLYMEAVEVDLHDSKINSFEVLTSASAHRILNSKGVDVSFRKTSVYFECAVSSGNREFFVSKTGTSPAQFDIRSCIIDAAEKAISASQAEPPQQFQGDVLLSEHSLLQYMAPNDEINPLLLHTFGRFKLLGMSTLQIGQPLGEFNGECPTILSNPGLPNGLFTSPVDDDGTPLKQIDIFKNGVFVQHIATAWDGQILDVPVTGQFSNLHIQDGATREEHLRGNNYIEIVSFSWFHPDPYSGDFSAEIRLGYRWLRGKKIPFTGGSLVGNVFHNILNTHFSKEVMQSGYYYGPRAMLLKDANIQ